MYDFIIYIFFWTLAYLFGIYFAKFAKNQTNVYLFIFLIHFSVGIKYFVARLF